MVEHVIELDILKSGIIPLSITILTVLTIIIITIIFIERELKGVDKNEKN